jgi:rhomboid protease GluP
VTQNPSTPDYPPESSYPEYPPSQAPPPPPQTQRIPISAPASRPYVTYTLLVLSILVFILQYAGQALLGYDLVAAMGMKVNESILQGEIWRLFTPVFLHGSILHLGFNMYALYIFGPGLERYYGHTRYILLYILAGFAGNVMSFIFSASPSLGSSTAIFGLLAAEGVFLYQNQKILGGLARRALNNLILIAVANFIIGLSPGIDNWGHMGGLLGGAIFAFLGGPILQVEGIPPNLRVTDGRESSGVVRAVVVDILIFGALAVATIFFRSS